MQKHVSLTTQYYESFEILEELVQEGRQLHDQAIFDFCARSMSRTARLIRKVVGMGGKHYSRPIIVKDCP